MRKKLILIVLFEILLFSFTQAQDYFKEIAYTVGVISYITKDSPHMEYIGTGTLIQKDFGTHRRTIFLVTNKHVFPSKTENDFVHFRIKNIDNNKDTFADIRIRIWNGTKYDSCVKIDPEGQDVAVIRLSAYKSSHDLSIITDTVGAILTYELLATRDTLKSFGACVGQEIVFLGFPDFFYDKRNISPILREGVIASDPLEDFYFNDFLRKAHYEKFKHNLPSKLNGFLIDANIYGGSSGSLIIKKPRLVVYNRKDHSIYYDPREKVPYIFGIATTSYFDLDSRSANGVRINLGGVIASEAIKRTIDLF